MIFNYLISTVVYLLFSYVIFAVALIVIYAHVYMHELFPLYTHTHHGRVLTTLDLHVQILDSLFLLCRCSLRLYASRIVRASPYSVLVLLSFQLSYYFLILVISVQLLFQSLYHMISCVIACIWHCSIHDLFQLDL